MDIFILFSLFLRISNGNKKVGVGAAWWRTVRLGGIGVQGDPSLAAGRFVDEAEFTLCVGEVSGRAPMPAPSRSPPS